MEETSGIFISIRVIQQFSCRAHYSTFVGSAKPE